MRENSVSRCLSAGICLASLALAAVGVTAQGPESSQGNYDRVLGVAQQLPPELSVPARLQVASRIGRDTPDAALTLVREAFAEATQAKELYRWLAVEPGAPAAASVEGRRGAVTSQLFNVLGLQSQAIRVASRLNLDEALHLRNFLPRPPHVQPSCEDIVLPDTSDRLTTLRTLASLVWGFPPDEETAREYRAQVMAAVGDELASVERLSDLGAAFWLVSAQHWSAAERRGLLAVLVGAMARIPPLPRVPLHIYQDAHRRILAAPTEDNPEAARLVADAWKDLMKRQLQHAPCLAEDGTARDAEARASLRKILESAWEPAVGGMRDDLVYVRAIVGYQPHYPRALDEAALNGFRVTPIWVADEALEIYESIRPQLRRPKLREPTVTGPDGMRRPFPVAGNPAAVAGDSGPLPDWADVNNRFARYRQQLNPEDVAAFHRVCYLWQGLLEVQRDSPAGIRETRAFGAYLESSPLFRERPAHWHQEAIAWLGEQNRHGEASVPLGAFPRMQAMKQATGLHFSRPRERASGAAAPP